MTGPAETAVIAQARHSLEATIWVDALQSAGIRARMFEQGVGGALGGAVTGFACYPIVVSREDIARARSVIADMGGASALAPVAQPQDRGRSQQKGLVFVGPIVSAALLIVAAKLLAG